MKRNFPATRYHLLEVHDESWCPIFVRMFVQQALHFLWTNLQLYRVVVPLLAQVLEGLDEDERNIVDLCSGGSGPLPVVLQALKSQFGMAVTATLTDLYPNIEAWQAISKANPQIGYVTQSVDATNTGASASASRQEGGDRGACAATELTSVPHGVRTLFASFHHFKPDVAMLILQDAVKHRAPIAIFELTERTLVGYIWHVVLGVGALVVLPFVSPFLWQFLVFLPVCQLVGVVDGVVSCLRTYTVEEMQEMTSKVQGGDTFDWKIGQRRLWYWPVPCSYLIGMPKTNRRTRVG